MAGSSISQELLQCLLKLTDADKKSVLELLMAFVTSRSIEKPFQNPELIFTEEVSEHYDKKQVSTSRSSTLDKDMNNYLIRLNVAQKKALLTVVKTIVSKSEWGNSKSYTTEMNRRFHEMETGMVKTLSLEDLEVYVRKAFNN